MAELKQSSWLWLVLALIQWCYISYSDGCLEVERNAFFQIKASINYPNATSSLLDDWGKSANCCDWYEIECNSTSGRVIDINLSDVRDQSLGDWHLNASLFLPFQQLNSLDLGGNNIVGCVKNHGFERLSSLVNLESLYLSDNNFNNSIVSSLGVISSLKYLWLYNNNLTGLLNIQEFDKLTQLEYLDIGGNNEIQGFQLSHERRGPLNISRLGLSTMYNAKNLLLQSLTTFPNLSTIYLRGNTLKGALLLPQDKLHNRSKLKEMFLGESSVDESFLHSLGAFSSLKILSLQSLNNSLPTHGLLNLKNLEMLDLSYTYVLDNNIFQVLGTITSLKILDMISCELNKTLILTQGTLNFKNLETLDLSHNENLDNNIFQIIGTMTSLKTLYISNSGLNNTLLVTQGLCKLKHLEVLDISNNNLTGTLPWCLANLTSLKILNLGFNQLTGNISSSPLTSLLSIEELRLGDNYFQVPFSLGPFFNHSKLKTIDFWGNEIYEDGVIDNMVPHFQLESLYMSGHGYGGRFPNFLYHQHELETVYLVDVQTTGDFPVHWLLDNNINLQTIYLANNSLSGNFQLPIHPHKQLRELDISSNHFGGHIPIEIGTYFPMLQFLNISSNHFQGSIPPSLLNICSLEWLFINSNHFNGSIPSGLSKCSSMITFDASNNSITSMESMSNMSSLDVLDLSNNMIFESPPFGFLPSGISEVYLSKNRLEGLFPNAFYSCTNLKLIDLSHNYLNGSIPYWIDRFSELDFLLLSHNNLQGKIPAEFCKLDKLCFIDLSRNNFSGHILHCLRSSSASYRKDLNFHFVDNPYKRDGIYHYFNPSLVLTTKTFSYRYQGIALSLISGIDISCNNFTGEIPHELGNLLDIHVLNLSHNSLKGSIPLTFQNLSQIESLDLSYNELTGTIPPELTRLNSLEVFNVSHNNLFGMTPPRVAQFATFEENSYKDNPLLCGPPLPRSCLDAVPPSSMSGNSGYEEEESGFMDMGAFNLTFVVAYVMALLVIGAILYINPYWRRRWFYFIDVSNEAFYYFVVDNVRLSSKFRV